MKLPVLAILAASFTVPWSNRARFFQALIITLSILVVIDFVYSQVQQEDGVEFFLYILVNSIVYVCFAVTCHRLVLLGGDSVPRLGIFRWSQREFRFLLWGLKIGVVFFILFMIILLSVYVVFDPEEELITPILVIILAPFAYFLSRVILLFPSTAADKDYDLRWAYKLTEGNGFQMMAIVVLIPLTMTGIDELIKYLYGEGKIISLLMLALAYIVTVFEIAAISLSYKYLTNKNVDWGET